jgi:glycosyltransferase involved in cell wall biosynthesis
VLIVGDGKSLKDLKDLAKELGIGDDVAFTGSVPYEEVPKYINAADVCVALKRSMESGFSSLKLYEYMACGRPIVASDVPGFEILRDSNSGLLVNPDDKDDVAKAILTVLKNVEMGKEMGRNGRDLVVKDYSWDATAKRIMAICEAVKG